MVTLELGTVLLPKYSIMLKGQGYNLSKVKHITTQIKVAALLMFHAKIIEHAASEKDRGQRGCVSFSEYQWDCSECITDHSLMSAIRLTYRNAKSFKATALQKTEKERFCYAVQWLEDSLEYTSK